MAFARAEIASFILVPVAWLWTAHELDTIGIEVFDRYLKVFPGELWILAVVLSVLTIWWMANLLPIRAMSAIFMLVPAEVFPLLRMEPSPCKLPVVVFCYVLAIIGMFGMFYPWHIRRAMTWLTASPARFRIFAATLAAAGGILVLNAALGVFL